ncbi:MAG: hypothetical protein R2729_00575 [Bryobacteraceae bacterium]
MIRDLRSLLLLSGLLVGIAMPGAGQVTISATPTDIQFYHQRGTSPQATARTVTVSFSNSVASNLTLSFLGTGNWLFVQTGPRVATTGYQFDIIPAIPTGPAALPVGVYRAEVAITAEGAAPFKVNITLTISDQPLIFANESALEFVYAINSPSAPPSRAVTLSATTSGIAFTAAAIPNQGAGWLSVSPTSGTTNTIVTVSVNPAGLVAGTYTGTIAVSAASAGNTVNIPVTFRVLDQLLLTVSPTSMQFDQQVGGPSPPAQILSVATSGVSVVYSTSATTQSGGAWLGVAPLSGTSPANLSVTVTPAGLTPGTYNGTVRVTAANTANSTVDIPVTLRVTNDPLLRVAPSTLVFTYQTNGSLPEGRAIVVSNGTNTSAPITIATSGVSWLGVSPTSANTPMAVVVTVNPAGLAPGIHVATINISGGGSSTPVVVPVNLIVSTSPVLRFSTAQLNFVHTINGANPPPQAIAVSSSGAEAPFNFSTSTATGGTWLNVTQSANVTAANMTVSVNPAGLTAGVYNGQISFATTEAGATAITIPVQLTVSANPLIRVPTDPLRFQFNTATAFPPSQSLLVDSSAGAFTFGATAVPTTGNSWLVVGQSGNISGSNIQVGANPQNLAQGIYSGVIAIDSPGAANSPQLVPAILGVSSSVDLVVAPQAMAFDYTPGTAVPAAQPISLTTPNTVVNYSATAATISGGSWLSVSPTGGVSPATLNVSVNPQNLTPGTYAGSITITSAQATTPRVVQVTLTVRQAAPTLVLSRDALSFAFTPGSAVPAAQQVQVTSSSDAVTFSGAVSTTTGGQWLTSQATSATTPSTLTIAVNPTGLTPGVYTGMVTITSTTNSSNTRAVNVTLTVASIPSPAVTNIVHAASFAPTAAVPGLIFTIQGSNLGPTTPLETRLTAAGLVDTTLGGVRVLFDGIAAPLLYVSPTQINGVMPYGVSGRATVRVQVQYQGVTSDSRELRVADANPGIFLLNQAGQGAILNADNSVNGAGRPADRGRAIVIYATGEGQTSPFGQDGAVPTGAANSPLRAPLLPVTVEIGGVQATVLYAGSAPQLVAGVLQINAIVPENAPTGSNVSIRVRVGAFASPPGVTVAIR